MSCEQKSYLRFRDRDLPDEILVRQTMDTAPRTAHAAALLLHVLHMCLPHPCTISSFGHKSALTIGIDSSSPAKFICVLPCFLDSKTLIIFQLTFTRLFRTSLSTSSSTFLSPSSSFRNFFSVLLLYCHSLPDAFWRTLAIGGRSSIVA